MEHGAGCCPAEVPGQLHRMSGQAGEPRLLQADPLRTLGGGTQGVGPSAGSACGYVAAAFVLGGDHALLTHGGGP
jgi:hypothetical protein